MSARGITLVIGTAAGAFLAAGLIPLATAASARADGDDVTPGVDTDFMSGPLQDFGLFTNQSFADPDDSEFVSTVIQSQPLGFEDVLTSGADPALHAGMAGDTVNIFTDPSDPALDSTIILPFTDPLAQLFTDLLPLGF